MKKRHVLKFLIILLLISQPSCSSGISTPKATPETVKNTPEAAEDQKNAGEQSSLPVIQTPITKSIEVGGPEDNYPDTIFYNGIVLTMEHTQPLAEAIAIQDEFIVAVGTDDEILKLGGAGSQMVDLKDLTLTPGFIDSHTHRTTQRYKWNFSTIDESTQESASLGWTGLVELAVDENQLKEMIAADAAGDLHTRIDAFLIVNLFEGGSLGDWYQAYKPNQQFSPYLRIAGLKIFIDFNSGRKLLWTQDDLNQFVRQRQLEGWHITMKAIGIESHELALKAYEYAIGTDTNGDYRYRIEHSLAVNEAQVARMAKMGIIASIQPSFPAVIWNEEDIRNLAEEEGINNMFRWRDYANAGVIMTASAYNPPPLDAAGIYKEYYDDSHISVMGLIYRSVTQIGLGGTQPESWMLQRVLSVDELLPMLTINGAYATFEEDVKGSLAPGKYADIVILSDNPLTMPVEKLIEIEVLMTMIGGNVEYCTDRAKALCEQGSEDVVKTIEQTQEITSEDMVIVLPGNSIEIAVQGPVTGKLSDFYPHMWNVTQMAVEDYGLVNGEFSVKLVQIDDRCEQAADGKAAKQLIKSHPQVVGVIGPLCSDAARGSLPVYQQRNLVSISGSLTQEDISTLFGAGGFNRTVFNDQQLHDLGVSENYIDQLQNVQDFYTRYESRYGPLPADIRPLMVFTYDAVHVLLNAIEETANIGENSISIKLSDLADAVRTTHDFIGLTGQIAFDQDGDRIPLNVIAD